MNLPHRQSRALQPILLNYQGATAYDDGIAHEGLIGGIVIVHLHWNLYRGH